MDSAAHTGAVAVLRKAMVTFLDQVSLSVASFAVGLAFILRGSPEQYGLYSFYLSLFYLLASAQNAVVNTPLMVLAPRLEPRERERFGRGVLGVLLIGVLATLLLVSAALLVSPRGSVAAPLVAACFLPLLLRDFFRANEFANLRPGLALRRDAIYAGLACAGVVLLARAGNVRAIHVFAVLAAAAAAIVIRPCVRFFASPPSRADVAGAFRESWVHSRWSLLGAGSTWVQSNAYIYVPFLLLGAREVAFLAAARLVMAPAALLANSWGNLFRPMASRHLFEEDRGAAWTLFMRSSLVLSAILAAYGAVALAALRIAPDAWIPADYRGLEAYLGFWAVVLLLEIVRNNASSLLQASLAFRDLALWGLAVAGVAVALSFAFVAWLGTAGSLVAMVLGELLLMAVLLLLVRRAMPAGRALTAGAP